MEVCRSEHDMLYLLAGAWDCLLELGWRFELPHTTYIGRTTRHGKKPDGVMIR